MFWQGELSSIAHPRTGMFAREELYELQELAQLALDEL